MSLPKEPRQKMINLMYLVLTALLALNVSSEILNAFKTVDRSLMNANGIVDSKDKDIMTSFKALTQKPETKEKAEFWMAKADVVLKESDALVAEIEAMKVELKKEAGLGKMGKSESGEEQFKEDDLEAATRLFGKTSEHGSGKGQGDVLKSKLQAFKDKLLADSTLGKELGNSLPIDLSLPKGKEKMEWSDVYFHMTPTVAALTILSKFENDVKNSSAQAIEIFHKKVGQVELIYDKFQAIASQSSQYLMPGQELVITGGVGAFNSKSQPNISIDGANVALNADGVGEYKTVVQSPGAYSKKVVISFKKPDGTTDKVEKEIKYTVGSPTGVNVSATAVNVLYRAIENPISITGGTKGAEAINAAMDNGTISKVDNNGNYTAKPGNGVDATINVTVDGKTTPVKFPVRRIPDPTPKIGASAGGTISVTNFKAQGGVRADMGDFVFKGVKFSVSKYTIICTGKGFEQTGPRFAVVDGAYFTDEVKGYVNQCKAGSSVLVQDIWVDGPDGRRKLEGTMAFSLSN